MTFEIARNINGPHTIKGGPAKDGVFFGTLPPEELPEVMIGSVMVAGSFPKVWFRDSAGAIVATDYTTEAAATAGTIPWPNATTPIKDRLQCGVHGNRKIKGIWMELAQASNWSDANLAWAVSHPGAGVSVAVPVHADSTAPTVLRTGTDGALIYVKFETTVNTNDIPLSESPTSPDDYWRRIDIGLTGTITGGTVFPLVRRVWPAYENVSTEVHSDYTGVVQPMTGQNYAQWPQRVVWEAGSQMLFGCGEWPVFWRVFIDKISGASGTQEHIYSSATGIKTLPPEYISDGTNFAKAPGGEYSVRAAKPADAAKMWVLTYTDSHDGIIEQHSIFNITEPALPAGGTLIRKVQTFLIGWRQTTTYNQLVDMVNMRVGCRDLSPVLMTSSLVIDAPDSLKSVAIEAEEATDAAGESSWFIVNTKTAIGVLVRGTLTLTDTILSATGLSLARTAGQGIVAIKIKDKSTPGAEAQGGELVISG